MSFSTVRELGRTLPDVEDGTAYGSPALKVRGRMFACVPTHRSAEPDSLVVCIDFAQRDELVADDPATYYLTPHYVNYAVVLVRLRRIHRDALRDLLQSAWRFVSSKTKRRVRKSKRR
jgi:hypothetical protein